MIDRDKCTQEELGTSPRSNSQRAKLIAAIRRVAAQINYRAPRQYGDVSILARALERRKIMPPKWQPGQVAWFHEGRKAAPKLEKFIRRWLPELLFPLEKRGKSRGK